MTVIANPAAMPVAAPAAPSAVVVPDKGLDHK